MAYSTSKRRSLRCSGLPQAIGNTPQANECVECESRPDLAVPKSLPVARKGATLRGFTSHLQIAAERVGELHLPGCSALRFEKAWMGNQDAGAASP